MPLNPKVSFALGWLVGRGQRHPVSSSVFMIAGVLVLLFSLPAALFGTPYALIRVREVRALEQPAPAKLRVLPPYSEVLLVAELPKQAAISGLALSYVEARTKSAAQAGTPAATGDWKAEAAADEVAVTLADGSTFPLICTIKTSFMKAETVAEAPTAGTERRRMGYRPGATITIEGTLTRDGAITAQRVYPGTPKEYIRYLGWQPGAMLTLGLGCAGLGLLLFAAGLLIRYL